MEKKSFIISLMFLFATLITVVVVSSREAPRIVQMNLDQLPMEIGRFHAENDTFTDSVYQELNADHHTYRHYRSGDGQQIDLYVGYYATAKGGRSSHNPYACLPGSGWGIIEREQIQIENKSAAKDVSVNFILARKDDLHTTMIHWYQSAGNKVISTGIQQNIERFIGRIMHNRNDGAFVQVTVYSSENDLQESRVLAGTFASEVMALLPAYWPLEE